MKNLTFIIIVSLTFLLSCTKADIIADKETDNHEVNNAKNDAQNEPKQNKIQTDKTDKSSGNDENTDEIDKNNEADAEKNNGKSADKTEKAENEQDSKTFDETEVRKLILDLHGFTNSTYRTRRKLIAYGNKIQPIVLEYLDVNKLLFHLLEILIRIGDEKCVETLIDRLPDKESRNKKKKYATESIIRCLHKLTHKYSGIRFRNLSDDRYEVEIKSKYKSWFEENRDYFYVL